MNPNMLGVIGPGLLNQVPTLCIWTQTSVLLAEKVWGFGV